MTEKLNSKELRGTILGTIFGDAHVAFNNNRTAARLDIYHKYTFLDLLEEKASVISQVGGVTVAIREKIDSRILQRGDTRKGYRLQTNFHPYFARLKLAYDFSYLSDRGLAWFWMDDGSLWWKDEWKYAYIAMDSYQDVQVFQFIDFMIDQYGVHFRHAPYLGRGGKLYNRVTLRKEEFLSFREIIRPHIVPSMYYKLLSAKELETV